MDLTAAIRLKIDRLRNSKTVRYNALSTSIEREVALLTQRSAELFTKLEDALEASVIGKSDDLEDLKIKEEEEIGEEQDGDDKMDDSPVREKQTEHINEIYDVDEDKDIYYGNEMDGKYYDRRQDTRNYYDPVIESKPISTSLYSGVRPPSRTPSLSTKPPQKQDDTTTATTNAGTAIPAMSDIHPPSKSNDAKSPESVVAYLRKRAQETQILLAEKHTALTELRKKHDIAMKRLDKLQSDLEHVSQKWESEERARIQSESTTALGKRKREEDDEPMTKRWKAFGLKGIEWGVLFGIGVASAMGVSKLN